VSVEDVEIVRRWREVLVDDDTEAAAALLAPDLEWVVVSGESLRGIDEVRKYYAGSGSGGPENLDVEFDPGELEDLGDGHVSALNHQIYRWRKRANSLTSGRHGSNTRSVAAGS
jgi:ketosteroid isomerase-like protein